MNKYIKHVLAVPFMVSLIVFVAYCLSWIFVMPIFYPMIEHESNGTPFWQTFLIFNGIGLGSGGILYLLRDITEEMGDSIHMSAVAQIVIAMTVFFAVTAT